MRTKNITTATPEDHYSSLGYLFYSLAASDGRVRPAEVKKLKELIAQRWLALDDTRDELGTDEAYYIEFSFDLACDQRMAPEEAFTRFRSFYEANNGDLVGSERQLIMDTAKAIAEAYGGKNKSELVNLSRLDLLLRKPADR